MNPKFACDNATKATHPAGAPLYSDVSMRLFTQRDGAELEAARDFHITRADWSYIKDSAYIKQCKANGWTFQGTTNAVTTSPDHAMRNEDGSPVLDHFQREGRYWSDCNNPAYRNWYVEQLVEWVELGADAIQRDEPTAQNHWDYEETSAYYEDVHGRLRAAVGRDVTFSCNLAWNEGRRFGGKGDRVTRHFDFGMSELGNNDVTPDFITSAARDTRRKGKFIAYTSFEALDVPTYRRAIAGCYANGLLFIVPWDQFAGTSGQRVFSKPEDMADLYGFVRANAQYLDGYEAVSDEDVGIATEKDVHAWLRAKPGDRQALLVLHLVDWGESGPTQVSLNPAQLFGDDKLHVNLLVPTAYDADSHRQAATDRVYEGLRSLSTLTIGQQGGRIIVDVPALSPWGILVIKPLDAATPSLSSVDGPSPRPEEEKRGGGAASTLEECDF